MNSNFQATQQRLWGKVQQSARGVGMSPISQELMEDLVEQTTQRLDERGLLEDEQALSQAEQSLGSFVFVMIDAAKRRGYNELREDTFAEARSRICPLWPIC